uniref:NR LBD domain-containing protein n=1 Tax=Acrobeloides nanus TaxID=290746 RepID=A0A914DKT6_9BILA
MPDGGYVKLSELEKFYENTKMVKGDPHEVAKVFEGTMSYIRNVVVEHMRRIDISEVELCALSGMFLWRDTVQHISSEGANILYRTRDEILRDLHIYYRNNGLIESEVTTKTAHLFLLIPKIENSINLFRENFNIAELFNMIEVGHCCKKINESIDGN